MDLKDIKDFEYVKAFAKVYDEVVKARNPEDYVIDEVQLVKLFEACEFFEKLSEDCDGEIQKVRLSPCEISGGVTAKFTFVDMDGERLKEFVKVLENASALCIDALVADNTVSIGITIPNVFVPKSTR